MCEQQQQCGAAVATVRFCSIRAASLFHSSAHMFHLVRGVGRSLCGTIDLSLRRGLFFLDGSRGVLVLLVPQVATVPGC